MERPYNLFMARNDTTSAVIDGILRCLVAAGTISMALIAPNILQALDKPTRKYFQSLDRRAQERELRRITSYMRRRGLLAEDYEHGLELTTSGKQRLQRLDFDNLEIVPPKSWDKKWRLVLFDIPETKHVGRKMLTDKLRSLGFQQLQQSVWLHPFPCRSEVETVCEVYQLSRYVTYIETSHIDHEHLLIRRFTSVLSCK